MKITMSLHSNLAFRNLQCMITENILSSCRGIIVTKRLHIEFVPVFSIMKLLLMLSVLNIDDGTLVKHYFLMVALIFYTKSYPFLNIPFRWEFLIKLTIVVKFINFEKKATKFEKISHLDLTFTQQETSTQKSKVGGIFSSFVAFCKNLNIMKFSELCYTF